MVLMNGTKRARNVSSTIANADNRCNGGMKKAGMAPTAGWMRKLNGVKKNYYFARTHQRSIPPSKRVECKKGDNVYYLMKSPSSMPRPFSQKKMD